MLKKLITLFLAFSLFSAHAGTTSTQGLKAAFDELNYSLTVEWDQKDKEFYVEQMKKFHRTMEQLQAQGLTTEQLIAFAKSEVKNERVAKDLETAFNMISINKMSSAEANKYILETLKRSYSSGASWGGEVIVIVAVAALIVVVALAVANAPASTGGSTGSYCYYDDYYFCDTYCYYDYYWGYTCYDDCYWTSRYICR